MSVPIDKKRKENTNPVGRVFGMLGMVIILAVVIMMLPPVIMPMVGVELYEVLTGSMEPEIPVGSLVSVSDTNASELSAGDIITYGGGGLSKSAIVTHRVVENHVDTGELITRGDANSANDPNPISYYQVIGKVSWHVPVLGRVYGFFSTINGKIIGLVGIALGIVFFGLESFLNKNNKGKK